MKESKEIIALSKITSLGEQKIPDFIIEFDASHGINISCLKYECTVTKISRDKMEELKKEAIDISSIVNK